MKHVNQKVDSLKCIAVDPPCSELETFAVNGIYSLEH